MPELTTDLHQHVPFIKWSAFAFFILSLFAVIKAV